MLLATLLEDGLFLRIGARQSVGIDMNGQGRVEIWGGARARVDSSVRAASVLAARACWTLLQPGMPFDRLEQLTQHVAAASLNPSAGSRAAVSSKQYVCPYK